jgi:hypothetical protein
VTYLQVRYRPPDHALRALALHEHFGAEVMGHLELVRYDGGIAACGLPIVRFTSEARLDEIIRHRSTGAISPASARRTPWVFATPGKMIGWDNPEHAGMSRQSYLYNSLEASRAARNGGRSAEDRGRHVALDPPYRAAAPGRSPGAVDGLTRRGKHDRQPVATPLAAIDEAAAIQLEQQRRPRRRLDADRDRLQQLLRFGCAADPRGAGRRFPGGGSRRGAARQDSDRAPNQHETERPGGHPHTRLTRWANTWLESARKPDGVLSYRVMLTE